MRSAKKMTKQTMLRIAKKTNPVAIANVSFDSPLRVNQSSECKGPGGGGIKISKRTADGLMVEISVGDAEGAIVSFFEEKTESFK